MTVGTRSTGSRFRSEMGARSVEVGGTRVAYVARGEGPPVVFVHGLGGCVFDWREHLATFADSGFRAIAIDLPGAGLSDAPPGRDFRVERVTDHVAAALRAIAGSTVALVGNSYGGLIALAAAIAHPDLVRSLVLVDAVCYEQSRPYFVPLFRIPLVPKLLTPVVPIRPLIRRVLRGAVVNRACVTDAVLDEYAREMVLPGHRESIIEIVKALVREDSEPFARRIPEVRAATLVVWGDRDPAVPLENGLRLSREIPGAELLVIPSCGHLPHFEQPEVFRRAVIEFLRRS